MEFLSGSYVYDKHLSPIGTVFWWKEDSVQMNPVGMTVLSCPVYKKEDCREIYPENREKDMHDCLKPLPSP
jgi:hypothetical protein